MGVTESKTSILVLSYRNCELYCCHLDGYKSDTDALLQRLSKIEAIFLSKPIDAKFRVWYNLDENNLNKHTMELIAESISRFQGHICKIAFIGLHGLTKRKFNGILKQALEEVSVPTAYFTDAESAKEWLV